MPAPATELENFVERVETIEEFYRALEQPGPILVGDMKGPFGVGKTTVLAYLHKQLKEERNDLELAWVDLAGFVMPPEPDDPTRKQHYLANACGKYKQLLIELTADLVKKPTSVEKELDEIEKAIRPGGKVTSKFSRFIRQIPAKVPLPDITVALPLPFFPVIAPKLTMINKPPTLVAEPSCDSIRRALTTAFAWHIRKITRHKQVVIFLDNFCHIEDTPLESWILEELIPTISMCKVILGRTDHHHLLAYTETLFKIPIYNFSEEESRAYVQKVLGEQALNSEWDKWVYNYCFGHPLFTSLLVNIIREKGLANSTPTLDIKNFLLESPSDDLDKASLLAKELVDVMSDRDAYLGQAIDASCVLREFNREALVKVLRGSIDDTQIDHIWTALKQLPGIDSKMLKNREEKLIVHEYFANARETWLSKNAPDHLHAIRQSAIGYYGELIRLSEEESSEGIWGRMHKYEDFEWQELSRHWLHHLLADSMSPDAGVELATPFFDAFFWWGEYIDFPFCKRLLQDLTALDLPANSKTRIWVDLLGEFHAAFPPQRRPEHGARWKEIRIILRQIWELGHLDNIIQTDATRWHLRGILQNYFASAYAVDNAKDAKVTQAYKASIDAFEEAEKIYQRRLDETPFSAVMRNYLEAQKKREAWFRIWINIWLAGHYAEIEENEKAMEFSHLAEEAIYCIDSTDREALARVYCTRGDVFFNKSEWEQALKNYAFYALYSLGFLIDDYNNGGDFYTLEFYREMVEKMAKRFEQLQAQDAAMATLWWQKLLEFWTPEGSYLLEPGSDSLPEPVSNAYRLNEHGRVILHALPLPRLPFECDEQTLEKDGLPQLSPGLEKRVLRTFLVLKERHIPDKGGQ